MIRSAVRPLAAALAAALLLSGCSSAPAPGEPTDSAGDFPRTIEVPAGPAADATEVTIATEPERIAALSYETAELVAALGLAERLVIVPEAVRTPALTNHHAEMTAVPQTIPTESTADPEQIIAADPDLVLLSARHGLDTGAGRVLAAAGIPVLILPNTWADVDDVLLDIRLIGTATGADDAAEQLAGTIEAGLAPEPVTDSGAAPRVLVLSNQAGRPFATAGAAFPLELVRLAGALDVSAELGMTSTGPITAEQVVRADPDGILLVDMNGSGRGIFADLLANPAVAALPAVADGRVMLVEGRQVQALGFAETVEGLGMLRAWVADL